MADAESGSDAHSTKRKGNTGESVAIEYLKSIGYVIAATNFRAGRAGEIDVVCYDKRELVFVEVKTRYTKTFGAPEDAMTYGKQKRIRTIARVYLYVNKLWEVSCRFDVIAIDYSEGKRELRHWRNAF